MARSSSSSGSCLCLPPCVSQTPGRTGGSTTREREREIAPLEDGLRSSVWTTTTTSTDGRSWPPLPVRTATLPPSSALRSAHGGGRRTDGRSAPPSFTCKSSGGSGTRREEKRNLSSSSSLSQSLLSSPGEADTRTGRRSLLPLPLYQAETKPHSATFTSSPELAFLAWEADEAQSGLE